MSKIYFVNMQTYFAPCSISSPRHLHKFIETVDAQISSCLHSEQFVMWPKRFGRFGLKDLSITLMVGAWCFDCCRAQQGLTVGIILLRTSVLCAVGSLSLPCLFCVLV